MTEHLRPVTEQVEKIREIAKTTTEKAKRQLEGIATLEDLKTRSHKAIQDVEERAKGGANRVAEETRAVVNHVQSQIKKPNFDALLSRISAKELLERMHADELVEYGCNVRNELYEKLGVVPAEDFAAAMTRIDSLEASVKALSKKRATPRKKTTKTLEKATS